MRLKDIRLLAKVYKVNRWEVSKSKILLPKAVQNAFTHSEMDMNCVDCNLYWRFMRSDFEIS